MEQAQRYRVSIPTRPYNHRRYSKPWIALLSAWPVGKRAEYSFGAWLGSPGSAGRLEILVPAGSVIAWGQKDHRKLHGSEHRYGVLTADGELYELRNEAAARDAYDNVGGEIAGEVDGATVKEVE